jgi:hypothetical protein
MGAIIEAVDWAEVILNSVAGSQKVTIYADILSALQAVSHPGHQSGQALIRQIARVMWNNEAMGKHIHLAWIPGFSGVPGNDTLGRYPPT